MFGVARVTFHGEYGELPSSETKKEEEIHKQNKVTVEHQQQAFLSPR